ncbi:MAG: pyroglutamyl-peptidase I [Clostridia bacterium]|nr:pyroglutamyl-peptidase I [Clostridia bacterium]
MRVMVTAFEPFGGEKINPTMLLLEKLTAPDGIELEKVVLPVVFGEAEARAIGFLNAHPADAVVMLGQAGGRAAITVERVAINFDDASLPDNAGNQPREQSIRENAPAAYFSTLPVRRMVDRIQESGVRGAVSLSAGAYVCNHLMYSMLDFLAGTNVRAGFIHVPFLPEQTQTAPSMPLTEMVRGISAAIGVLAE